MTIWKNWCRFCGARAVEQNLCHAPVCIKQAQKVAILAVEFERPWVVTKEMVLERKEHVTPKNDHERLLANDFLSQIEASKYDDVTEIVRQNLKAAKILKIPRLELRPKDVISKYPILESPQTYRIEHADDKKR